MSLQSELAAASVQAGLLETENNALKATVVAQLAEIEGLHDEIDDLETKLAELTGHHDTEHHGVEPPPPDPDPDPDPGPGPQPPDDVVQIDPGNDLIKAINSEGTARPFMLLDGAHKVGDPLPLKDTIQIVGESLAAVLTGSGPTGHHFYAGTAKNVKLQDFTVQDFGGHTSGQDAAMISGGVGWLIDNLAMWRTDNTFIRGGIGWKVMDCQGYDAGRYGFAGSNFEIHDFTGARLGWKTQGVPIVGDNNRGASKFGRASKGVKVFGSKLTSCWQGWWWDIANEDGECWDLDASDIARMGLNLEAGYFGPAGVGPGFKGGRIKVRNSGQVVKDSEPANWPVPCAVQISLSGNVDLVDLDLDDGRVGVGLANSKDHYQLRNAKNTLSRLGVGNVRLTGVVGPNFKFGVRSAGTAHQVYPQIRQPKNIDLSALTVESPVSRDW